MRQVALLNLNFKPSINWGKELKKSEHEHQDSEKN